MVAMHDVDSGYRVRVHIPRFRRMEIKKDVKDGSSCMISYLLDTFLNHMIAILVSRTLHFISAQPPNLHNTIIYISTIYLSICLLH